jgi:hypothetical protein
MKDMNEPTKLRKYEWRKAEKEVYAPKAKPEVRVIPKAHYFMLSGKGNPNHSAFSEAIGVLYSLSYAIRMMPKKGRIPDGYFEYTVYPLEGIWDLAEEARHLNVLDKDALIYTLMIKQPDFVTVELAQQVIEAIRIKKPLPLLDEVKFACLDEGLSVQMVHIGSYDEEPKSFSIMEAYCEANHLRRVSKIHKEIYLSDFRKTEASKLKTILRFQVENKETESV